MGKFLRHEPCPSCGSRDNLGVWTNGVWCFGCGYRKRSKSTDALRELVAGEAANSSRDDVLQLKGTTSFPATITSWIAKYGLGVEHLIRAGAKWDDWSKQLNFPLYDERGDLRCVQARNFDPDRAAKAKYFNRGNKDDTLQIYRIPEKTTLDNRKHLVVITEDILSAIKVSNYVDAMPALGTAVPAKKLTKLLQMGYQGVIVWLDGDKWREGMEIADKAKWIGMSAKTIYSKQDPKEYSNEQIQEFVDR